MRSLFVVMLVLAVLSGCDGESPAQTVEWYKSHDAERQTMLAKCEASPGELSLSPDCINAQQADKEIKNARRGWIKPTPLDFSEKKK